jgi:hypothetical protein
VDVQISVSAGHFVGIMNGLMGQVKEQGFVLVVFLNDANSLSREDVCGIISTFICEDGTAVTTELGVIITHVVRCEAPVAISVLEVIGRTQVEAKK